MVIDTTTRDDPADRRLPTQGEDSEDPNKWPDPGPRGEKDGWYEWATRFGTPPALLLTPITDGDPGQGTGQSSASPISCTAYGTVGTGTGDGANQTISITIVNTQNGKYTFVDLSVSVSSPQNQITKSTNNQITVTRQNAERSVTATIKAYITVMDGIVPVNSIATYYIKINCKKDRTVIVDPTGQPTLKLTGFGGTPNTYNSTSSGSGAHNVTMYGLSWVQKRQYSLTITPATAYTIESISSNISAVITSYNNTSKTLEIDYSMYNSETWPQTRVTLTIKVGTQTYTYYLWLTKNATWQ